MTTETSPAADEARIRELIEERVMAIGRGVNRRQPK